METYDSSMAARFRQVLLARAGELDEVLRHEVQAVALADEPREGGDFKDAAVQEIASVLDEAHCAQAAAELARIRGALARLYEGRYGECLDCGDPIDLRRLHALPAAAFCTSCQCAHEWEPAHGRR